MRISYSSLLSADYASELEDLLFFNPEQHRVREKIISVVEKYGTPTIHAESNRLHVRLKNGPEVQTIYALAESPSRSRLVGVLIYLRSSVSTITVLHVAVKDAYSSQGRFHSTMMVPLFIARLREIGRQIKGVTKLQLLYGPDSIRDIPV